MNEDFSLKFYKLIREISKYYFMYKNRTSVRCSSGSFIAIGFVSSFFCSTDKMKTIYARLLNV